MQYYDAYGDLEVNPNLAQPWNPSRGAQDSLLSNNLQ